MRLGSWQLVLKLNIAPDPAAAARSYSERLKIHQSPGGQFGKHAIEDIWDCKSLEVLVERLRNF